MIFGKRQGGQPDGEAGMVGDNTSGGVWMSGLLGNYDIGNKQGLRSKFFGHDWQPADFKIPLSPVEVRQAMNRYVQGLALQRSDIPEAAAVWNERSFSKVRDLFTCGGGAYVVRGKLAEVLSRFDLGEGGLIPFPIYQADLETPYPGEFFLLNFGCIKNTILIDQCEDATKFLVRKATGVQVHHINDIKPGGEVVLSSQALSGADLWFEEAVHEKIFVNDALAQALFDIGMGDVLRLTRCRVVANKSGAMGEAA